MRVPEPRRHSASRLEEEWGWIATQKQTKAKERKGER
jgi:hypothetical protein